MLPLPWVSKMRMISSQSSSDSGTRLSASIWFDQNRLNLSLCCCHIWSFPFWSYAFRNSDTRTASEWLFIVDYVLRDSRQKRSFCFPPVRMAHRTKGFQNFRDVSRLRAQKALRQYFGSHWFF